MAYNEDESYTGNGPYTSEPGYSPVRAFNQWQAGKIAETNAKIDASMGKGGQTGNDAYRQLANTLYGVSQQRFGRNDTSRLQNLDTGFGAFVSGRDGGMPDAYGGGFVRGNTAYNVNDTSQEGLKRVTTRGASPLYTNIDPSQAVAGLRNQTVGSGAEGLERMQRANDIRGQMIANRGNDIPAGGYEPGILGDMGGGRTQTDLDNEEKTRRWAQDALLQYAKNNPEMRGVVQQIIQSGSARDINANNIAGRMNELGLQGRNQLASYGLQGKNQLENTLLGEGLRGRNQLAVEDSRYGRESGLLDKRIAAEAPYREAQTGESAARAGLYGVQSDAARRQMEFDKSRAGMRNKVYEQTLKDGRMSPQEAMDFARSQVPLSEEELLQFKSAFQNRKANGGLVGYADGGAVDPKVAASQKLLLEMQQKYGGAAPSTPQPVAPVPAPQPVQQQPRQETWAEKARRIGTGGLDRRMEGYAYGGPIAVGGRQVMGSGTGKSDSLPAEIDGEHPAALSTGEFVMPVEAVRHFGLDRLNKMVAAARKGLATDSEAA